MYLIVRAIVIGVENLMLRANVFGAEMEDISMHLF